MVDEQRVFDKQVVKQIVEQNKTIDKQDVTGSVLIYKDVNTMNVDELKAKLDEKESKIKILEWDKNRNQLQYSKENYLKKLKTEVEEIKKELSAF